MALLGGEAKYRYPVRLIIVSQTLPHELGFELQVDGSWSVGPRGFAGLLSLNYGTALSPAELRRMIGGIHISGDWSGWKPTDKNVHRLQLQTRSNALLVCLLIRQMQRDPSHELMDAAALLLDRAQRIVQALKAAGIGGPEQLRAIAWMTLIGGPGGSIERILLLSTPTAGPSSTAKRSNHYPISKSYVLCQCRHWCGLNRSEMPMCV